MTAYQEHNRSIIDQFSLQAAPFSKVPEHSDAAALRLLLDFSGASRADNVLDVACGPGIVTCAFAEECAHATGIDLTPAMIDQAHSLQAERRIENVSWTVGDVRHLPFPDNHFSLVVTRFTFHHFPGPGAILTEMIRVCRPGGRILVVDVAPEEQHQGAYDATELLRDPSHVRALTPKEFADLFGRTDLTCIRSATYRMPMHLDRQLAASFPNPGDEARIRKVYAADIGVNNLGLAVRETDAGLVIFYPILAMLGTKW